MKQSKKTAQPDNTALRTALWRALHVLADDRPYVIEDKIGYDLIKPEDNWQERPDMKYTRRLRASIVARARFVEDLAKEQIEKGVKQYVLLGAGLDSFAQRNTEIGPQVDIYEIDQPDTLAWKEEKLIQNGYKVPGNLHFVPVDFETSSWWNELLNKNFDISQKAFVSCTGVTLYLTKEAIMDTLEKMTLLVSGSVIAIAFYLPLDQLDEEDQPMQEIANKGAEASGTPFLSFLSINEVVKLAEDIGLKGLQIISTKDMTEMYFKDRKDNLLPASGEYFLVASI
ncbi:class I SAM-dependent methyltransferase [Sinomicrobium weinanense]|uniref:S-adenosyl-L-methionine-dependent methyltransferase n=1 Tax=Sinomicrobium weinanense TaxID=2842200 RepID=A0A926JUN4_9FLAO|nr:class I SAM-dependent methyltransferase [Sinomicrobium weinanense]MBC9797878.1 class I SAM-dependent methyltransferase [Sinomicrobium weinanense]MBU3122752.1 class I SAM-dependent methyltransferase [Sinomicrobium weinanense]